MIAQDANIDWDRPFDKDECLSEQVDWNSEVAKTLAQYGWHGRMVLSSDDIRFIRLMTPPLWF